MHVYHMWNSFGFVFQHNAVTVVSYTLIRISEYYNNVTVDFTNGPQMLFYRMLF